MVELIEDFPFMLSLVEAFLGFFSRITHARVTVMPPSFDGPEKRFRTSSNERVYRTY